MTYHRYDFPKQLGLDAGICMFWQQIGFLVKFYVYIQILRSIGSNLGKISQNLFSDKFFAELVHWVIEKETPTF